MQLSQSVSDLGSRRRRAELPASDVLARQKAHAEDDAAGLGADRTAMSFRVEWACSAAQICDAQRLRFRVFAGELGARLAVTEDSQGARDIDPFDSFCDHLLVRANAGVRPGQVVATCRVLSPDGARRAGRLYTATEFDLAPLSDLLPHCLEMGRVCVDPQWRNGLVVMALWRELGKRMAAERLNTLIGCSSISLCDGGNRAERVWNVLRRSHLVAHERRVRPWNPLALQAADEGSPEPVPALIKAYLRCGGKLLGPPAIDAEFNTADFPMLMHLGDLPSRYEKRIFGTCE